MRRPLPWTRACCRSSSARPSCCRWRCIRSGIATSAARPGTAPAAGHRPLECRLRLGTRGRRSRLEAARARHQVSRRRRAAGRVARLHPGLCRAGAGSRAADRGDGCSCSPALTLFTAWTNDWHGLFWGRMTLDPVGTLYTFTRPRTGILAERLLHLQRALRGPGRPRRARRCSHRICIASARRFSCWPRCCRGSAT